MDDWIREENARPYFEAAASLVGYRFDDADWDAVAHGMGATDAEANEWFDYPLDRGERSITVSAARDPGASVVLVRATGDETTIDVLGTVATLLQRYVLTK
jgi:hypothetical protein